MTLRTTIRTGVLAALLSVTALGAASAQPLPAIFAGGEVGDAIYIDTAYFDGLAGRADVKVIDIREADAYAAGHIPGAISIPNSTLTVTVNGLRNQLPEWDALEAIFAQAGLSYDDTIVIYGDDLAGRSYIAFDQSGFQNLHILEGGWTEWTGAVSTEPVTPTPSDFVLNQAGIIIVDAQFVLEHIGQPDVFIIDSRGPQGFEQGHIPGSYNIPTALSHEGATLLPVDDLVAALQAIGVTPDSLIITTCGTGNLASNQLAVLRDLGYTNIVLYDGSWQEWANNPALPREPA